MRKLGLGKEVVSLSLVVTEVSRAGGMRYMLDRSHKILLYPLELSWMLSCDVGGKGRV